MMKPFSVLLPCICSLTLATGCAVENDDGITSEDESGADVVEESVAIATQAVTYVPSGWSSLRGGTGPKTTGLPAGNYYGMQLYAGSVVEAALFQYVGNHPAEGGGMVWGPTATPFYPGNGGTVKAITSCDEGYYVIGIHGKSASDNIGKLGIVCGKLDHSDVYKMTAYGGAAWGTYTSFDQRCQKDGEIVIGVSLQTSTFVRGIQVKCGVPKSGF